MGEVPVSGPGRAVCMEINKCECEMEVYARTPSGTFGRIKAIPLAIHSKADFFPSVFTIWAEILIDGKGHTGRKNFPLTVQFTAYIASLN